MGSATAQPAGQRGKPLVDTPREANDMAGSETRIKTTTTTFRMTPEERSALVQVAEAQGLGPSSFARKATLEAAGRAISVRKRKDALDAVMSPVLGQLGKNGNLLNQLARHAHVGGRVDPHAFHALQAETERLINAVLSLKHDG